LTEGESGGYRGDGRGLLLKHNISIGDTVEVDTVDDKLSGIIMPRYEAASDEFIVIKLKSGYNVGIRIPRIRSIRKLSRNTASVNVKSSGKPENKNLPRLALISTGGTIASKVDYRTGGVHPALSASELYDSVPELAAVAQIEPEVLLSEYSENLNPGHWTMIAQKIADKVQKGTFSGVVVSHGTDTMHYSAAALSFALQRLPVPVVLVGAQRSSDRPSSDAALNLLGATTFAVGSEVSGVFVAMHHGTSDDAVAIHVGTRVRKNHTSRRDAFESIDVTPVALVRNGRIEMQKKSSIKLTPRKSDAQLKLSPKFDASVALLKYHPGFDPRFIDYAVTAGYKAIILEGTGLGHVSRECYPALKNAIKAGLVVCMTSQCIWGRVGMTVYDTGRDLLEIGVVPLSDMISETATVKAMWALANTRNVSSTIEMMKENVANEMTSALPIS